MRGFKLLLPVALAMLDDEYLGCYDSGLIADNRVYKNTVKLTPQGIKDCKDGCRSLGYDMYGFECPMSSGNKVHCECLATIPANSLKKSDCTRSVGHCNGSSTVGGFLMGTAHRMTIYRGAPEDQYFGCFDSSKISDNRVYKNTVSLDIDGIWDCKNGCQNLGYQYYGFECPMQNGLKVHCECIEDVPGNSLKKTDCARSVNHCNGASSISGINMGTAHRMTVYRGQPQDDFLGCYDSQQVADNRPVGNVDLEIDGVWECREGCRVMGYLMYGFECPMKSGTEVHCECQNSEPSSGLKRTDCANSINHCNGASHIQGFQMGTAYRMTLYRIAGVCPDTNTWDNDSDCDRWSDSGFCEEEHVDWMNSYCEKTCCEKEL